MHNMACLFSLILFIGLSLGATDKPNIVLIMADDIGFADIGCYGAEATGSNQDYARKNTEYRNKIQKLSKQ